MSWSLNELGIWIYTHVLSQYPGEVTPVTLCVRLQHFSPALMCCGSELERQLCIILREISSYYHIFICLEILLYTNEGKNLEDINEMALLGAKCVSGYYK